MFQHHKVIIRLIFKKNIQISFAGNDLYILFKNPHEVETCSYTDIIHNLTCSRVICLLILYGMMHTGMYNFKTITRLERYAACHLQ